VPLVVADVSKAAGDRWASSSFCLSPKESFSIFTPEIFEEDLFYCYLDEPPIGAELSFRFQN
jgi:hypothetical protein